MSGLVGQTKGLGFSLTTLELSLVQGLTQGSDTERFLTNHTCSIHGGLAHALQLQGARTGSGGLVRGLLPPSAQEIKVAGTRRGH